MHVGRKSAKEAAQRLVKGSESQSINRCDLDPSLYNIYLYFYVCLPAIIATYSNIASETLTAAKGDKQQGGRCRNTIHTRWYVPSSCIHDYPRSNSV